MARHKWASNEPNVWTKCPLCGMRRKVTVMGSLKRAEYRRGKWRGGSAGDCLGSWAATRGEKGGE